MLHLSLLSLTLCTGAALNAGSVRLELDEAGRPVRLVGPDSAADIGGVDFRLEWAGRGEAPDGDWPLTLVEEVEEKRSLTVLRVQSPWELAVDYWAPSEWCIARQARVRNLSDEVQEVLGASYVVQGSNVTTYAIAPAFHLWAGDGDLAAALCESTDPASVAVTDEGAEHRVGVRARVQPGERVTLDPQYLWLAEGDAELAPPRLQEWYRLVGLMPPSDRPEWAQDAVIYSTHPGGHIDSWFQDIGGFGNLQAQLPYVEWLGANTLWLLPIYTYCVDGRLGDGCPYGPADFYEIEPALGGEEAAREFVDAAHARGMRVLIDIVPHGGSDPHVADKPEWRLRNEDGTFKEVFGWTCDYGASGWQDVMADVAHTWVRHLGIDGYRVDVSEGMGENLGPDVERPSYAARGGPIAMLGRMREGARASNPDAILFPEGFDRLPWLPHTDISYGFRLFFWLKAQQGRVGSETGRWADLLTRYLREEEAQAPAGTLIARQLTNHDMDRDHGHVTHSFGVGASQALMAALSAARGVPFVYQEQERGAELLYARLFQTRDALPELRRGDVLYGPVEAPKEVFTVWRWTPEGATLALVNFAGQTVTGEVVLDADRLPCPAGAKRVGDVWSGEVRADGWTGDSPLALAVTLEPYEAAFLAVRPEDSVLPHVPPVAPPDTAPGQPAVPRVEGFLTSLDPAELLPLPGGAVAITAADEEGAYTISLDPVRVDDVGERVFGARVLFPDARRWMVNTASGPLEGVHVPRHRDWTPSTGYGTSPGLHAGIHSPNRLWESAMHPLHPDAGFVAVSTPSGQWSVELPVLPPTLSVYLDDGSSRGDDGVLKLIIAAADPFAARVQRSPGVIVGEGDDARATPVSISFRLNESLNTAWESLAEGTDYHTPARLPSQVAGDVDANAQGGMLYLPQPGAMEYGMEIPAAGEWHVWIELRRSERAVDGADLDDGYALTIDGQPTAFRWIGRTRHAVGNSYVDWVALEPTELAEGPHALRVTTLKPWCAVGERVLLTRDPQWTP